MKFKKIIIGIIGILTIGFNHINVYGDHPDSEFTNSFKQVINENFLHFKNGFTGNHIITGTINIVQEKEQIFTDEFLSDYFKGLGASLFVLMLVFFFKSLTKKRGKI